MSVVLKTEHLSKRLTGEVPVVLVEDINLSINSGEFVCIMGPSGSGKSSLLYLLGLLDVPSKGKIWLDGEDTSTFGEDELAKRRLEKLGFVFQFHFLLAEFTNLDNVALPMRRLGRFSEQQIQARAMELKEGELSAPVEGVEGTILVHLVKKVPFESKDIEAHREKLAPMLETARVDGLLGEWIERQRAASGLQISSRMATR